MKGFLSNSLASSKVISNAQKFGNMFHVCSMIKNEINLKNFLSF